MSRKSCVSDHCMLRVIERVHGIDLTFIREEIARITAPARKVGARSITTGGFTYILGEKGVVVTVIAEEQGQEQRRRRSPRDFRECEE